MPPIDWNDPRQRADLVRRVGLSEYERQFEEHRKRTTRAENINGYSIREIMTAYGGVFIVEGLGLTRRRGQDRAGGAAGRHAAAASRCAAGAANMREYAARWRSKPPGITLAVRVGRASGMGGSMRGE
jgi:hypothetical protein